MTTTYETLRPNRPLEPGDHTWIRREGRAPLIVEALQATPAVGVIGPLGVGKSTEIAAVVTLLRADGRSAFHVPLERHSNVRTLTPDQLHMELAGALTGTRLRSTSTTFRQDALSAARGHGSRPVVLVDGLEKAPPAVGMALLDTLGELVAEMDVVTVLPWYAAYGPGALRILADHERIISLEALDAAEDAAFFDTLLQSRAGLSPEEVPWRAEAAAWSGGLPRLFLHLTADALVHGGTLAALERAAREHQDTFRRSLLPGDSDAIRGARGTDGREIELDRRLRLLACGLLLERTIQGRVEVEAHPLLQPLLAPR